MFVTILLLCITERWVTTNNIKMAIYDGHDIVSDTIAATGHWEKHITDFLAGGPFLDVGANIGVHTVILASRGATVYAIEPMTHNRALINATLARNKYISKNIKIFSVAIGVEVGTCRIYSGNINVGDGNLICYGNPPPNTPNEVYYLREQVPVIPLRDLSINFSSIKSMKIDVEGTECSVFETMPASLRPKRLVVEVNSGKSLQCARYWAKTYGCKSRRNGADLFIKC